MAKEGRTGDAMLAAECGRALSPFEHTLYFHYVHLNALGYYMNDTTKSKYIELIRSEEAYLCSVFLEAIRKKDAQKIWDIAQSVWFLKGVFESNKPADVERTHLLSLKQYFEQTGVKWPIQSIAESLQIATGKKIEDQGDGYSALRRKCKALGVPVAKSRRGPHKKAK